MGFVTSDSRRERNIAANIRAIAERVVYPHGHHDRNVTVVCYGPSLRDTWQEIDTGTTIVSISGAHDYLMGRGIAPDYHVEFDPRPHKARHIERASPMTTYYLASCVHPDVLHKVHKWAALWHAAQSDGHDNEIIRAAEPGARLIPGGSSTGLRALELFYALGFRHFDIHGMDSSFADDGNTQWAGPHHGNSRHRRDTIPEVCAGRRFQTSVAFRHYAVEFLHCRKHLKDAKFVLHGYGLLQTMAAMQHDEEAA